MNVIATHNRRLKRRNREETARLLVLARGYHGAVDACLRNGWEEILALLLPRGNSGAGRLTRSAAMGATLQQQSASFETLAATRSSESGSK